MFLVYYGAIMSKEMGHQKPEWFAITNQVAKHTVIFKDTFAKSLDHISAHIFWIAFA